MKFKPDWDEATKNIMRWWQGKGLAVYLTVKRDEPRFPVEFPEPTGNLKLDWIDPAYRLSISKYEMAWHDYYLEAFPYFDTQIGPGSLGIILGSQPHFVEETVWYNPVVDNPEAFGRVQFEPENNLIWQQHLAVIEAGLQDANGQYLVGIPDLIENLDTLAALRGDQEVLVDLIERPNWVMDKLSEINQAYFTVFDLLFQRVKDKLGGNAFSAFKIWGPGRTAKLQCDISATLSPRMFRKFAFPYLQKQCRWLDFSLYHLDGTNCLQHLPVLLEIQGLNAIEWTPQAGRPGGGSSEWYDLYRQIKKGGKAVQAVGVELEEVIPLLDAIGPEGVYILLDKALTLQETEHFLRKIEPYRNRE